jgi:hypothetical protein
MRKGFVEVTALTAVNGNPKYLACVPAFIEFWLALNESNSLVQYSPKVLLVGDSLPQSLEAYSNWCEIFEEPEGVPSALVSQVVRILQPSLENSDYVITTDVDMLPLSDRVFKRGFEILDSEGGFLICRDVLSRGQYPICYNIASPGVWKQLNFVSSVRDIRGFMTDEFSGATSYSGSRGGAGWFLDQELLYKLVSNFEKSGGKVTRLQDRDSKHKRFDRAFSPFPLNWVALPLLFALKFTDYHVHHPIRKYSRYLRALERTMWIKRQLTTFLKSKLV